VLPAGTPVLAAGGERVGTVGKVLAVDEVDVFDGLVVVTERGPRFVDAEQIAEICEGGVLLTLDASAAAALPADRGGPPAYDADPADGGWRPEGGGG
jgi:hypothetical protein